MTDAMTHFITFITPNYADRLFHMITSWNGNVFRVHGLLWGESTCQRWIPLTKDQQCRIWCFLWCQPKQTFDLPVIWDALVLILTLLVTPLICRCGRARSHENSITTCLKILPKILPKNIKVLLDDTSAFLHVAEKKLSEHFIIMITYHSTWTATRSRQIFWITLSQDDVMTRNYFPEECEYYVKHEIF